MKKFLFNACMAAMILLVSCSKESDLGAGPDPNGTPGLNRGPYIDPNGAPGSGNQRGPYIDPNGRGSGFDPQGKSKPAGQFPYQG